MILERLRTASAALLCIAVALLLGVQPDPGPAPGGQPLAAFSAKSPGQSFLPSHDRHADARRTLQGLQPGGRFDLDDGPALLPVAAVLHQPTALPEPAADPVFAPNPTPLRWRAAARPRAPPSA